MIREPVWKTPFKKLCAPEVPHQRKGIRVAWQHLTQDDYDLCQRSLRDSGHGSWSLFVLQLGEEVLQVVQQLIEENY